MDNREIAKLLSESAKLMELHNENEFKVKSLQNAAFLIGKLELPLSGMQIEEIESLKGIGKSTSKKIFEIINTGTLPELQEYLIKTPSGILEMMRIKGIGPKKTALIWKELLIESPGELLYACNENRLVELKGFGLKTQDQIRKAIEFTQSNAGLFHYATLEKFAEELLGELKTCEAVKRVSLTGEIRRKCEVLSSVDILVGSDTVDQSKDAITRLTSLSEFTFSFKNQNLVAVNLQGVKINFIFCDIANFQLKLFASTGSHGHLNELKFFEESNQLDSQNFPDEQSIYKYFNVPYLEPETREGLGEIIWARSKPITELIRYSDLKGCLHNHSTYSDGINSLKDMAVKCIDMKYEYFGICDHSKSAFYANGMQVERVHAQHFEIDSLNKELAPFKIFKGIESDILHNGALDYDVATLASFDFVVASIHSNLKMDVSKATNRLLNAIENPFTTILGHPTGRLLLAREGYPIHHKEIIDACALNGVVIELNAHPFRLDLDWRWVRYAVECGVMISINPDAHAVSGIHDMYYGVCVGRKGLLTQKNTFNALSRAEMEAWFANRKSKTMVNSGSFK